MLGIFLIEHRVTTIVQSKAKIYPEKTWRHNYLQYGFALC